MQKFTITQPSIAAGHGSAEYRTLDLGGNCGTSVMTGATAFVDTDR